MPKDLKNKPLVEAILELRWALPADTAQGIGEDPHYRLLLGRFSDRVEGDYPVHEPLPTAQIPDAMAAHMVQHRFRCAEGSWPLVQIGPGILTVNDTEKYTWDDFKVRCEKAVRCLFDAHPAKKDFKVKDITLRYIDAVEMDLGKESVFSFLQSKMKTAIALPDVLFADGRVKKNPAAFNWQASYPLNDPSGLMTLRFAVGKHKDKPALIWETLVQSVGESVLLFPDGFTVWLGKAHDLTDDWFFKLIEGDLEKRFSGE